MENKIPFNIVIGPLTTTSMEKKQEVMFLAMKSLHIPEFIHQRSSPDLTAHLYHQDCQIFTLYLQTFHWHTFRLLFCAVFSPVE